MISFAQRINDYCSVKTRFSESAYIYTNVWKQYVSLDIRSAHCHDTEYSRQYSKCTKIQDNVLISYEMHL